MISVEDLSFEREGRPLFQRLSFHLSESVCALVGANGVGKSTLAQLLAGALTPARGRVARPPRVVLLGQNEERPNRTVGEELLHLWDSPWAEELARDWLAEIPFDRSCRLLSGGEWTKVRLTRAFASSRDYLILDEPTNHLDRQGRELLLGFLRRARGGILLITHDRELLQQAESILEMHTDRVERYPGDVESFFAERKRRREASEDELNRAKRERKKIEQEGRERIATQEKRMRSAARRAPNEGLPKILLGARKRKAQVTHGRQVREAREGSAQARARVEEALVGRIEDAFLRLDFASAKPRENEIFFEASALNLSPSVEGPWLWARDLSFLMRGRQRWHLSGPNGAGKSTLLSLLRGVFPGRSRGEFTRHPKPVAFLDQHQSDLDPGLGILEQIMKNSRFPEEQVRNELAFYGFTGGMVFQPSSTLSGGERLRASLALLFLGTELPKAMILDEPSNHLDLQSLEILEEALRRFEGLVVLASHDRKFVEAVGITHVLRLERGDNAKGSQ